MPRHGFIANVKAVWDLTEKTSDKVAKDVNRELGILLEELQKKPDSVDLQLYKKIFSGYQRNIDDITGEDKRKVKPALDNILKLIEYDEFLKKLFLTPANQLQFTFDQIKPIPIDVIIDYMTEHPEYIAAILKILSQDEEAQKYYLNDLLQQLILLDNKNILTQIEKSGILNIEFGYKKELVELFKLIKEKGLGNVDSVEYIFKKANNLIKYIPIETWKTFANQTEKHKDFLILESSLSNAAYIALRTFDTFNKVIILIGVVNTSTMDNNNFKSISAQTAQLYVSWMEAKAALTKNAVDIKLIDEIETQVKKVIAKKQLELEKISDTIPSLKTEGKSSDVSFYQIQGGVLGRYQKQEDAYSFGSLPGFESLTTKQKDQVQKEAFSIMQKKHGRKDQGSTAISSTLSPAGEKNVELKVANVGDSTTFILKISQDSSVACERVNLLHDVDNKSEEARVKSVPGATIAGKRLGGSLAVTRAIGDDDIIGISHEAEITTKIISVNPGEKTFVITACDGLTEMAKAKSTSDVDYIKKMVEIILQRKKIIDVDSLASDLAKQAMLDGTTDNLTVLATQVNPQIKETLVLNIFDGHGGKDVSSGLGKDFLNTLSGLTLLSVKGYTKKAEIDELLRELENPKTETKRKDALQFVRQKIEDRLKGSDNQLLSRNKQIQTTFIKTLQDTLTDVDEVQKCVQAYYHAVVDKKTPSELQNLCDAALAASRIQGIKEMPERLRSTHIKGLDDNGFDIALKDMETAFKNKAIATKKDTEKPMKEWKSASPTSPGLYYHPPRGGESKSQQDAPTIPKVPKR